MRQEVISSTIAFNNFTGLNEYLLVIHPDDKVYNKINAEKQSFYNHYRQKVPVKTRPHITVASFMAREEMEETLIRWIQRVSSQQKSFRVALNNYSGFPEHTIYLRVQDHQPFEQLTTQLNVIDSYVRSNGCPAVTLINRPHLSIARRLPVAVYEKAMIDYSQKIFHESFTVHELVLLRRSNQYDTCKVINIFRLLPGENNLFN